MNYKTGINVIPFPGVSVFENLNIIKRVGFDSFFTGWSPDMEPKPRDIAKHAEKTGLIYQSIHSPYSGLETMWKDGLAGDAYLEMLKDCLRDCAGCSVPIMIAHPFIGFHDHTPTEVGVRRFRALTELAAKLGVKIAYENVEGEEYLAAIMESCDPVSAGFCLDTGHEVCYNRSKDMLSLYGDRLIATHFNDNLGVRGEDITPADDLHLLPFDGVVDFKRAMERIRSRNYTGIITFELKVKGGAEHTRYRDMSPEEYLTEAHNRALKVVGE